MRFDLSHWNANLLKTDLPAFNIEDYVAGAPRIEDYDLAQKLETWREVGVVVFEDCVQHDLLDRLLEDIEYVSEHRADFELEVEYRGQRLPIKDLSIHPLSDSGIKFNCLENISMAARRLSLTPMVTGFLRHVFQDPAAVIQSLTFWRGSEQAAHLDYPWVCIQNQLPHLAASWVPLEDIHPDAGPLAYYPGSHKPGVIPPFDWGSGSLIQQKDSLRTPSDFVSYLAERIDKLGIQPQIFLPKRGDVLIWHGNVLHGGTKVQDSSRTRRSYVTHYTSLSAYPSEYYFPDAFATHRYTSSGDGYVFDHPWTTNARLLPSWSAYEPSGSEAQRRRLTPEPRP